MAFCAIYYIFFFEIAEPNAKAQPTTVWNWSEQNQTKPNQAKQQMCKVPIQPMMSFALRAQNSAKPYESTNI